MWGVAAFTACPSAPSAGATSNKGALFAVDPGAPARVERA